MSHSKEREEKICLNCATALVGRYCQVCGQQNTEPKETVWGLVSHFFNDITHFDGKFFSTVKYLITKPGFLSTEYLKGKRASYLHPIRMYVFTSAFFFIIFFSVFNPENFMGGKDNEVQLKELKEASSSLKEKLPITKDSVLKVAILRSINNIDVHVAELIKLIAIQKIKDSVDQLKAKVLYDSAYTKLKDKPFLRGRLIDSLANSKAEKDNEGYFHMDNKADFHSVLAYDSVQKELPDSKKDGWFTRSMMRKATLLNDKYKDDKKEGMALFLEKFMHTLPQALFVSLPVFALILLMLYARRKFYYVDHGIFAIHLYCAVFLILLVYFGIDTLKVVSGWGWLNLIKVLLVLCIFFYLYKAMHKFYGQGRFKTILKFIILNIFSFFVVLLLVVAFFVLSLMRFS